MPAMPRPNKKSEKIMEKIIGKPDNKQSDKQVYVQQKPADGINRAIDSWYNHKI